MRTFTLACPEAWVVEAPEPFGDADPLLVHAARDTAITTMIGTSSLSFICDLFPVEGGSE
jgi:hypothetical protein